MEKKNLFYSTDTTLLVVNKTLGAAWVKWDKEKRIFTIYGVSSRWPAECDNCFILVSCIKNAIYQARNQKDKRPHFWAEISTSKSIYRTIEKWYAQCLAQIHSDLFRLVKAYRWHTGKVCPNLFWFDKLLSLNNQYLINDYCRYHLYHFLIYREKSRNEYPEYSMREYECRPEGYLKESSWLKTWASKFQNPKLAIKYNIINPILPRYIREDLEDISTSFGALKNDCFNNSTELKFWIAYRKYARYKNIFIKSDKKRILQSFRILNIRKRRISDFINLTQQLRDFPEDQVDDNQIQNWNLIDLSRATKRYHEQFGLNQKFKSIYPDDTELPQYPLIVNDIKISKKIKIEQLTTVGRMRKESEIMRHCVGKDDYIVSCLKRNSSIYHISYNKEKATLELDITSGNAKVRQVHGPCNQPNKLTEMIKNWFLVGVLDIKKESVNEIQSNVIDSNCLVPV